MLKDVGARFLYLPPLAPDLDPIEIDRAFSGTKGVHALILSKLRTLIGKDAAGTCDALWKIVGDVCDLFTEGEGCNFFKAAGYETD